MSKKQKLTPWFEPDVKPVRAGVYIATVRKEELFYRYWDGRHWHHGWYDPQTAEKVRGQLWSVPVYWRGLAKEPK